MENLDFKEKTKTVNVKKFLKTDNEKTLLIYSPTSFTKNNLEMNNDNYEYLSTAFVTKDKERIDGLFNDLNNYEKIISIGGGTALDIGKYLSSKFNKKMIAIPGMLSTNAYATNKVALVVNDKVLSLDAVSPTEIYFDYNILVNSIENNLFGFVDIFSIYTALNDWDLAIKYNNESKHIEYDNAKELLRETIDYTKEKTNSEIKKEIEFIYRIIGESGLITNRYGSGKPESGSEHIFAKALEREINIPHAVSVSNGIVLMILSRKYLNNEFDLSIDDNNIISILRKLNMFELNTKYNITYNLIEKVFMNLTPRSDRFSVVDLIYKNNDLKEKVLRDYKEIMKGYVE